MDATATQVTPEPRGDSDTVTLDITGMSCASCAMRIEKKLNRIDDVYANVNYATEQASVEIPAGFDPNLLVTAVHDAGYSATVRHLPGQSQHADDQGQQLLEHRSHELSNLRRRAIIAAVLSVPTIAISMVPALQFDYWGYAVLVLALPVVLWAGWPFHRAAWLNLRHGATTMDTLISVGTLSALIWSLVALFVGNAGDPMMRHAWTWQNSSQHPLDNIYLEVAAGVVTFVLAGRYFEKRAKYQAGAALIDMLELGVQYVAVITGGVTRTVPIDQLRIGGIFIVKPGERVAADGIVTAGNAAMDMSMITGEAIPVEVNVGDEVTGGTINTDGHLQVRATRVGADTQLAQMAKLVTQAQEGKANVQRLADRISAVFVPIVLVLALVTLLGWLATGHGVAQAFSAAVAVLIIACPCALGLATPTALLVGTSRGAHMGIIIRGPQALETAGVIDVVAFDKTGTLTTGRMEVDEVYPVGDVSNDDILRYAASLEARSEHPIGQAIAAEATRRGIDVSDVEDFKSYAGLGVSAFVNGTRAVVGQRELLDQFDIDLPAMVAHLAARAQDDGKTVVAIAWEGRVYGLIVLYDRIKETSAQAVRDFVHMGITPVLITGDNERSAAHVAEQLGITHVHAHVLPHHKLDIIARLQSEGHHVAMMGDGVNDAPALAQADLGIAMGTGADVAKEAADITVIEADVAVARDAVRLARATLRTIRTNLFWAFAYNTAAIPLAAFGLLNPMIAGAAMALSSVFVVSNSLRLRRFRATGKRSAAHHFHESPALKELQR